MLLELGFLAGKPTLNEIPLQCICIPRLEAGARVSGAENFVGSLSKGFDKVCDKDAKPAFSGPSLANWPLLANDLLRFVAFLFCVRI